MIIRGNGVPPPGVDYRDLKILSLLSSKPEMSQVSISRALGITQPAVAARIKKLKERGILRVRAGVDPAKLGLHVAKVDVVATRVSRVLERYRRCPYFVCGLVVTGRTNLCLFFAAEDVSTLEAIVDNHLRVDPDVVNAEFNIVVAALDEFIMPLRLYEEVLKTPPCGSSLRCEECKNFEACLCRGCPATGQYKGVLFRPTHRDRR